MNTRDKYGPDWVASMLGIGVKKAREMMRTGVIPSHNITPPGQREHWRTTPEALKEYCRSIGQRHTGDTTGAALMRHRRTGTVRPTTLPFNTSVRSVATLPSGVLVVDDRPATKERPHNNRQRTRPS